MLAFVLHPAVYSCVPGNGMKIVQPQMYTTPTQPIQLSAEQQTDLVQKFAALQQQNAQLRIAAQRLPPEQQLQASVGGAQPLYHHHGGGQHTPDYCQLPPQLPDPHHNMVAENFMKQNTSPVLQGFLPVPVVPSQLRAGAPEYSHKDVGHQPTPAWNYPPPHRPTPPPPPPLPQHNYEQQSLSSAGASVQEDCGAYGRGTAQPHSYDRDCGVEGYPDARIATSKCMQADAVTCKFDVKAPPPPPLPPKPPGTFTSPPDSDDDDRPYELVPFKMK